MKKQYGILGSLAVILAGIGGYIQLQDPDVYICPETQIVARFTNISEDQHIGYWPEGKAYCLQEWQQAKKYLKEHPEINAKELNPEEKYPGCAQKQTCEVCTTNCTRIP